MGLIYVALCADERGTNSKPIISKKIQFYRIAHRRVVDRILSPFWESVPHRRRFQVSNRNERKWCPQQLPLLLLFFLFRRPPSLMHIHHAALFWLSDSFRRRKTTEVICFAASNVRVELSETEWASPLNLKLTG